MALKDSTKAVLNKHTMQSSAAVDKFSSLSMLANAAATSSADEFATTPMPIADKENDMNAMNIEKIAVHIGKMTYALRFGTDITNGKDEKKETAEISPQKKMIKTNHGRVSSIAANCRD